MTTYSDDYGDATLDIRVMADRQRGMSRTVGDLLKWRRDVDKDRALQGERLGSLTEDMRVIKRLLIGLLVTAVTGSASVTIAILLATRGKS